VPPRIETVPALGGRQPRGYGCGREGHRGDARRVIFRRAQPSNRAPARDETRLHAFRKLWKEPWRRLEYFSTVGRAIGSAMPSTLGSAISTDAKGRVARGADKARGEDAARALSETMRPRPNGSGPKPWYPPLSISLYLYKKIRKHRKSATFSPLNHGCRWLLS
jgi:hypothetical protein